MFLKYFNNIFVISILAINNIIVLVHEKWHFDMCK